MQARRLIENSAFEPAILHVIFQAFDDAWAEIAHHFNGDSREVEQARTRLAHAVLIVARDGSDDPERLKDDALQVMALAYRHREPAVDLKTGA